jgi:hypothetical protein
MADNFNLAKFLRNNQLLKEGIGGYKDIKPMKEDDSNEELPDNDGFEPTMGALQRGTYKPDADIVNDFVQGMRPYYKKDPSFLKRLIKALKGDSFGAFELNEEAEDFNISQDEFFGRMMGLAHPEFEDISPIVKKTIDNLREDGFDDQDIIDFLATDFSLDEEVSGVQMEGEEFDWKPIDQQGKTPFKNLSVTITDDEMKINADNGFDSQSYTKDDIKDAMGRGEYLRFRGKNLQLNTKMKAWANS